jgi:hypothetical protein
VPSFAEAIFAKLDHAISAPVSPELRRVGDPTPAVVYEVTEWNPDFAVGGSTVGTASATVRFDCVADRYTAANDLAFEVIAALGVSWTQSGFKVVAVGAAVSTARAMPDDGQEDAERIASITYQFLTMETT